MIAPLKTKTIFLKSGTIMKKEYISEMAWSKIFNFLNSRKDIYIKTEKKSKSFIEAIFWIAKTGAQWRELPEVYGKWNSVFNRFNEWTKKGIWESLLIFCTENPDLEYVMIDATIVRAHACSAGYKTQGSEGLGRSKGGFTSKIHTIVDALGNPLKFILTAGQRHDITQAEALLNSFSDAYVIGDKGYDSNALRSKLLDQRCIPVIPSKSNSKNPYEYDKHIYKERHVIECFFSKLKHFRRVFSRFDKSARSFLSFLSFVGAYIWLK